MSTGHTLYLEEVYGVAGGDAAAFPDAATLTFGKALLAVCGADGLAPKEKAFFAARHDAVGISPQLREELDKFDYANADIPQIVASFNAAMKDTGYGEGMARALLYDAIRISWKDQAYSAPERAALRKVARELGVGEPIVAALENLVEVENSVRNLRLGLLWTVAPAASST